MTREEAIKFAHYAPQLSQEPEVREFYRMCERSLRAQQAAAKLDRSRWEGCEWCKQRYCDNCFWQIKMKDSSKCGRCIDKSEWSPLVSYCSNCGMPLTEEAWAELERRINE